MGESFREETDDRSVGRRWLDMVGRGHLEDDLTNTVGSDGLPLPVGRFDELCAKHVGPLFAGLEATRAELGEGHPEYLEARGDVQAMVDGYLVRFGVDPAVLEPPTAA